MKGLAQGHTAHDWPQLKGRPRDFHFSSFVLHLPFPSNPRSRMDGCHHIGPGGGALTSVQSKVPPFKTVRVPAAFPGAIREHGCHALGSLIGMPWCVLVECQVSLSRERAPGTVRGGSHPRLCPSYAKSSCTPGEDSEDTLQVELPAEIS